MIRYCTNASSRSRCPQHSWGGRLLRRRTDRCACCRRMRWLRRPASLRQKPLARTASPTSCRTGASLMKAPVQPLMLCMHGPTQMTGEGFKDEKVPPANPALSSYKGMPGLAPAPGAAREHATAKQCLHRSARASCTGYRKYTPLGVQAAVNTDLLSASYWACARPRAGCRVPHRAPGALLHNRAT